MCKNLLQQYAQNHNLGSPVYISEAESPPHARRFSSKVCLDGKSYKAIGSFSKLKEAEQESVAFASEILSVDMDGGLYKSLLQEFDQEKGLLCPSYVTGSSGLTHKPVFVSTVKIGCDTFLRAEASTKNLA
ncbi:hypothetical protein Salat_1938200 [Sesamum alatum]|uniref:DRBM domain-containing protein n=1 Tax=Sesamum alatum TaxID=300844 RepID=A0AAE1Y575_9LAMI|nr:hypothetical protein Salat_1938200 [Sesamum alatum]